MSLDEFRGLQTDEGRIRFLAEHTGLHPERVTHIYLLGEPWPLGNEIADLGRQANEAGIDPLQYIVGLAPLIEMSVVDTETKFSTFKAALARGETPAPIPELESPTLKAHISSVANLSGEDEEIVKRVGEGILAHLQRLAELVREECIRLLPPRA